MEAHCKTCRLLTNLSLRDCSAAPTQICQQLCTAVLLACTCSEHEYRRTAQTMHSPLLEDACAFCCIRALLLYLRYDPKYGKCSGKYILILGSTTQKPYECLHWCPALNWKACERRLARVSGERYHLLRICTHYRRPREPSPGALTALRARAVPCMRGGRGAASRLSQPQYHNSRGHHFTQPRRTPRDPRR